MDWNSIREEFESTDITLKDLADKHGIKPGTLRSRKNREGWNREEATQRNEKKSVATQRAIRELNENEELSEQQKNFCLLYLKYYNATKAYKEAYGCSYPTANSNGPALLVRTSIQRELARLKEAQRHDLYIDSLAIKQEWLKQSFADVTDFVEFGTETKQEMDIFGNYLFDEHDEPIMVTRSFVRLKESAEVDGSLLQEVKMGRDGVSVKLHDKQKAMQELMKLLDAPSSGDKVVFVDNADKMEQWLKENGDGNGR